MKRIVLILGLAAWICSGSFGQTKPHAELVNQVAKVIEEFQVVKAKPADPVSVAATLVWSENKDQFAIVMKSQVLENWNIYAYVPETQPFISTEVELKIPDGVKAIGEWKTPKAKPYEHGVLIYKGDLVFSRFFEIDRPTTAKDTVKTGLFYQACDASMCFPPQSKSVALGMGK